MNAGTFGFAFATRAADPFGTSAAVQEAGEAPIAESSTRRREPRAPASGKKLTAAATSGLTASGLLELVEPTHSARDIVVSSANFRTLSEVVQETRRAQDLHRHGLRPRSKLLFCGPPGCGKTLCAEVLASELKLPLVVARLDSIITTYLGETASNLRKIFDGVSKTPVVLFLDEFDALARARTDTSEHSEIRRVVNSLLMMIDRYTGSGILIAATNLANSIDEAAWRRFDDVLLFDRPDSRQIRSTLKLKLRNYPIDFEFDKFIERLYGLSFAEIERICIHAIKRAILSNKKILNSKIFADAIENERARVALRTAKIK